MTHLSNYNHNSNDCVSSRFKGTFLFSYIYSYVKTAPSNCCPTLLLGIMILTNMNLHFLKMIPHIFQFGFSFCHTCMIFEKNIEKCQQIFNNLGPALRSPYSDQSVHPVIVNPSVHLRSFFPEHIFALVYSGSFLHTQFLVSKGIVTLNVVQGQSHIRSL